MDVNLDDASRRQAQVIADGSSKLEIAKAYIGMIAMHDSLLAIYETLQDDYETAYNSFLSADIELTKYQRIYGVLEQ